MSSAATVPAEDSRPGAKRQTRRDAQRNRDALLTAAQAAFAEHGIDASLEQIARDAGLAIGTLYRHFPQRVDLVLAAFEPRLHAFLGQARDALDADDPWEAFCSYFELLFGMQADDRGFNDFISMRFPQNEAAEAMQDQLCDLMDLALQRGQESGVVRSDIDKADILTLIWANGRIIEATQLTAPEAWRRHLNLMLDAFRAQNRHDLQVPPLTDQQMYDAMAHLSAQA